MASYLQVENISKSYGDRVLFSNISFNINEGDKIALVAPNGTGKSSLLKILAGIEHSDRGGEVKFMRDIRVAFLDLNTAVNLHNGITYAVEEVAVVRNHEQGASRTLEVALKILDNINIEVVGGLIHNKEVGILQHHARQSHTLCLATRELTHRLI